MITLVLWPPVITMLYLGCGCKKQNNAKLEVPFKCFMFACPMHVIKRSDIK